LAHQRLKTVGPFDTGRSNKEFGPFTLHDTLLGEA
jgi:hypothetical protein